MVWVMHSISLSSVRERVVTYYTKCLVEMRLNHQYLMTWVGGSTWATLFVSCLQSQGCVWTLDFFFSAHTGRKASGPWGDILWIWQKAFWIIIVDYTFKLKLYSRGSSFRRLLQHLWQHSVITGVFLHLTSVSSFIICSHRYFLFVCP